MKLKRQNAEAITVQAVTDGDRMWIRLRHDDGSREIYLTDEQEWSIHRILEIALNGH